MDRIDLNAEDIQVRVAEVREALAASETEGIALEDTHIDFLADVAVQYLRDILSFFGENAIQIDEYEGDNGELILDVNGGDLAVLIGRHGRTLDALQTLLNSLMSSTFKGYFPITVDIESYKTRRKQKLQDIARSYAARAKERGKSVALPFMSAYDRRLVHLYLKDDETIETYSEGEEPHRRIIVSPVSY